MRNFVLLVIHESALSDVSPFLLDDGDGASDGLVALYVWSQRDPRSNLAYWKDSGATSYSISLKEGESLGGQPIFPGRVAWYALGFEAFPKGEPPEGVIRVLLENRGGEFHRWLGDDNWEPVVC